MPPEYTIRFRALTIGLASRLRPSAIVNLPYSQGARISERAVRDFPWRGFTEAVFIDLPGKPPRLRGQARNGARDPRDCLPLERESRHQLPVARLAGERRRIDVAESRRGHAGRIAGLGLRRSGKTRVRKVSPV